MSLTLLYPSDPFHPKKEIIDSLWQEEAAALAACGFETRVIDTDNLNGVNWKKYTDSNFLYRGWMLTPDLYEKIEQKLNEVNARFIYNAEQYASTHYLPGWYEHVRNYTAETIIVDNPRELKETINKLNWSEGYFLKDFVKSLKTGAGSRISNADNVDLVLKEMAHYRGVIEGGICIRRHLEIMPNTEVRYFALNGIVYSPSSDAIPEMATNIASKFKDTFISIDIAKLKSGELTLIEIGNGQVSDSVGWKIDAFAKMIFDSHKHYFEQSLSFN